MIHLFNFFPIYFHITFSGREGLDVNSPFLEQPTCRTLVNTEFEGVVTCYSFFILGQLAMFCLPLISDG